MRVGLIDVDGHNFPNLAIMKASAYYKAMGDSVDIGVGIQKIIKVDGKQQVVFNGLKGSYVEVKRYDKVIVSKVFTSEYSADIDFCPQADQIVQGGSGYDLENKLPAAIESVYPDYSLYPSFTESYGFLTRGCPRGCPFCVVAEKEGRKSIQVSELSEFHRGQKEIKLLDPNLLACQNHERLLVQLADSKAWVDFTQGLDVRLINKENIALLQMVKKKMIHFAWDREQGSDVILRNLILFKETTCIDRRKAAVYILTNYDTDFKFDLYRVDTLRKLGYDPYVMIYDKPNAPQNVRHLQRWVNNKKIWRTCDNYYDFNAKIG